MSNTFLNGESLGSIRGKLNANTLATEQLIVKTNDYTASVDQDSGNVTAQTANSISDNTKVWTTNQFVGSVVKMVTSAGEEDYGVVASNTATTLTLDDNHLGYTWASYRIMSTFTLTEINSINSFNITANDCALVLPSVALVDERTFVQAYIENSNNGDHKAVIVCKGTDRQRGRKWGALIHRYESVTLWSHYLGVNHWDILNLENVKRFAALSTTGNISIASATYVPILTFASTSLPESRRYTLKNVGGIGWLKYESIVTTEIKVDGILPIQRTGGGTSLVELTIRRKRFSDSAIIDSTIKTIANFSGDETKTIPISIPIEIEPNDEITLLARRDAGTIVLLSGATLLVTEM